MISSGRFLPDDLFWTIFLGSHGLSSPGNRPSRLPFFLWTLEPAAQKLEQKVSDDCGPGGDGEVAKGENIYQCGDQTATAAEAGALELAHQKIRVKKEDDESDFDYRSPEVFVHGLNFVANHFKPFGPWARCYPISK
jgi:hypothetical protein